MKCAAIAALMVASLAAGLALPAHAGIAEGTAAYKDSDYATAFVEFQDAARAG